MKVFYFGISCCNAGLLLEIEETMHKDSMITSAHKNKDAVNE